MSLYDGVDLRLNVPHSARMYDYFLGGITNFAADREAAGQALAALPWVRATARANRAFMHRSTRALAEAGLDQFLDIGTGIPTSPNLHEIAQQVNPRARVVYVDNDPIVLSHAQALLTGAREGRTAYVEAELTEPAALLAAPGLRDTIDLARPVALSLNAVLHFVPDDPEAPDGPDGADGAAGQRAHAIVEHLKAALAPGSALVLSHVTADFAPEEIARLAGIYRAAGAPGQARAHHEIARFFDGWTLLAPGLVPTPRWRPAGPEDTAVSDTEASLYAAVAIKP
ncbi:SAM-dependent methyltransferase [Kitasatospora sp. NBC_01246]|uniref:SAM-dependent methyltransferase n=1 Tax=Kitasatospora sp. NBC_01246 TaxID=2903570 RepID=UPI002E301068|nr:SAM-dependent methyltransferase [Kitasatospora sp. NBC_01246]